MNDIFIVPLTNSDKICLIDSDKAEEVMRHKWYLCSTGYIICKYYKKIRGKSISLVRFLISEVPINKDIDHTNRNKLDNRLCNLRIVTHSQNCFNSRKRNNASSKYKGVSFNAKSGNWEARIGFNYKDIYGGRFSSEKEAALKANELYKKHYGEFALLNQVE